MRKVAGIVVVLLVLLWLAANLKDVDLNNPTLTFQPEFLPVEITVHSDGRATLSASRRIVTPVGSFTFGAQAAKGRPLYVNGGDLANTVARAKRLVLRHVTSSGRFRDDLVDLRQDAPVTFVTNASQEFHDYGRVMVLYLHGPEATIRVQKGGHQGKSNAKTDRHLSTPTVSPSEVETIPPADPNVPGATDPEPTVVPTTDPSPSNETSPVDTPTTDPSPSDPIESEDEPGDNDVSATPSEPGF